MKVGDLMKVVRPNIQDDPFRGKTGAVVEVGKTFVVLCFLDEVRRVYANSEVEQVEVEGSVSRNQMILIG